jgi:NAD(P)-dependent dehydrogenase (short-subunit alcohol dehydrogenase family)
MKIRVNCICPGIFPSEMTTLRDEKGELILGTMGSKAVQRCTMSESPHPSSFPAGSCDTGHRTNSLGIGRPGRPQEIAAPILLLASQGGMYMNDTCINVDGGRWMVSTAVSQL